MYEQFVNQFSKEYPDFELIDLENGTSENYPILLVAVGENKNDGLVLDKNVILVSLKLIDSNRNEEIHHFKTTVTKQDNQELPKYFIFV